MTEVATARIDRLAPPRKADRFEADRFERLARGARLCLLRLLEQAQQFAVKGLVAGDDISGRDWILAAVEVGNVAARLAHEDETGRDVPRREVALPIRVKSPGRDPGEIEGSSAEAAQAGDLALH